jgi:hypothetical protein
MFRARLRAGKVERTCIFTRQQHCQHVKLIVKIARMDDFDSMCKLGLEIWPGLGNKNLSRTRIRGALERFTGSARLRR